MHDLDDPYDLPRLAEDARQAVRQINHLTIAGPPIPAPELYPVLGSLVQLGHGLHQALGQLARGLHRSPEVYQLYEADPGKDPHDSIEDALAWLDAAASHAAELGDALNHAHTAIAGQGWTSTNTDPDGDHQ